MIIVGVDEVGRGPLAGPVVAAAVIIPPSAVAALSQVVNDSKKLTAPRRHTAAQLIRQHCVWAVSEATVAEIDTLNIWGATQLAMRRALSNLSQPYDVIHVDGPHKISGLTTPQVPMVGGDGTDLAIGAASILAKVHRDGLMADLASIYPHYGWQSNAGYGTASHRAALAQYGPTAHHRTSFAPIKNLLSHA